MSAQQGRGSHGRSSGFRGRFSGPMRGNMSAKWKRPSLSEPLPPTKGPVLAKIDDEDLADVSGIDDRMAKITGYTEVTSFNWLNEKDPAISVPG